MINSKVLDWENGSAHDPIRNNFVIPFLADYINKEGITSIIDVGAATGYLAKETASQILHDVSWTLIDKDPERLNYAKKNIEGTINAKFVCADILEDKLFESSYEAVLVSFSLLELGASNFVLGKLTALCAPEGSLILILPDVWQDVISQSAIDGSTQLIANFIDNPVSLMKTDRFTGEGYPFLADRFERIINCVMQLGYTLQVFQERSIESKRVYGLVFKKQQNNG